MTEFIQRLIGDEYLATAIMSIIPMIELKGGIVFALGTGMNSFYAFALAYAGSVLVFFLIFFLLKPLLKLLKKIKFIDKIAIKAELYFQEKANSVIEKQKKKNSKRSVNEQMLKEFGVFIFIAIPLPLTGVWMGTAIAVFLDLKFKNAVLPVVLGNLVAGSLVLALAKLCMLIFNTYVVLDYILYALFGLAVILLAVFIIKVVRKKHVDEKDDSDK